jgi:hypothetical protein
VASRRIDGRLVKVDSSDVRDPEAVELAGEEAVAATKVEGLAAIGWDDIRMTRW